MGPRSVRFLALLASVTASCVEPSHGSRIVANFTNLRPAALVQGTGRTFLAPHFETWATIRDSAVVRLLPFAVVPVVEPASPCLIYGDDAAQASGGAVKAGELVMAPIPMSDPVHVQKDKLWLQGRVMLLSTNVFAVTSASDGFVGRTDLDLSKCQDNFCWLDHAAISAGSFQLERGGSAMTEDACASPMALPATGKYCLDYAAGRLTLNATDRTGAMSASYRAHLVSPRPQTDPMAWSNAERLTTCARPGQAKLASGASNPAYDPSFYIGNAIQLSAPRNGSLYGLVDALDPNAGLQIGGINVVVPYQLDQMSELFLTVEDHNVGSPDPGIANRTDPANRGPLVLYGRAILGTPDAGRGLINVNLVAPVTITVAGLAPGGHASVYVDLDDDTVQF